MFPAEAGEGDFFFVASPLALFIKLLFVSHYDTKVDARTALYLYSVRPLSNPRVPHDL